MKKLAILGAGGHAKVIADAAFRMGWTTILFYSDFPPQHATSHFTIEGTFQDLLQQQPDLPVVIGIGDNTKRMEIGLILKNNGFTLPPIIHPQSIISSSATIKEGSVVFAGAVINPDAIIHEFCIINTHSTIEHDCIIQQGSHISPGATLGGHVTVGKGSWVGVGASVRHLISIGDYVMVGAGAAVVKNVPNNMTVVGVPALPYV